MKNKLVLMISGAIVLVVAGVVSLFSVFYAQRGGSLVFMGASLRNTIEIPLSQADSLSVDYGSKNLEVHVWQEDKIVVKEYLNSGRSDAKANVEFDGKKAIVTGGRWGWNWTNLFWGGLNERIEIYLPKQGIQELELLTGSGNIHAGGGFAIETQSASIRAGSGNITIKGIEGAVTAEAGSGNITIEELAGSCEAEAGSGNLRISAREVTGDITLQTGSGNQRLELPGTLSFALKVNTGSGNIHTDYDGDLTFNKKGNQAEGQVGDAPACQITSHAGSGNVTIKNG